MEPESADGSLFVFNSDHQMSLRVYKDRSLDRVFSIMKQGKAIVNTYFLVISPMLFHRQEKKELFFVIKKLLFTYLFFFTNVISHLGVKIYLDKYKI